MNDAPPVIHRIDELDADWLTAALRSAGHRVDVMRVAAAPIGTGQTGATYRLEYELVGEATAVPRGLVVKVAAPADRTSDEVGFAYWCEVTFYREVVDTVAVRAPHCYLALIADDSKAFTLVLEDVSAAVPGDQIAGADPRTVNDAARNLAGLHGPRWDDSRLWDEPWATATIQADGEYADLASGTLARLLDRIGDRLGAADTETLQECVRALPQFVQSRPRHFAPLHGDYRLDNLLFSSGDARVTAVDWQGLTIGLPARDLAFLLGSGLSIEDRRAAERDIVEAYRRELERYGVARYSATDAFDDYRIGLLQCPLIVILGLAYATQTARGDEMFTVMARRSCAAIRDLGTLDAFQ